ncbi:hypothetical protein CHS0354_032135 [Potamilus streckersoni]|uniref:Uncharacterized protein n=1 Tax=Potamilus streckersoni TaxID=2493646 RepID=A0AAE0WE51_9BIVA|nr:hypothetical protein CHS0354_032135 [Potamilus streckersoni]
MNDRGPSCAIFFLLLSGSYISFGNGLQKELLRLEKDLLNLDADFVNLRKDFILERINSGSLIETLNHTIYQCTDNCKGTALQEKADGYVKIIVTDKSATSGFSDRLNFLILQRFVQAEKSNRRALENKLLATEKKYTELTMKVENYTTFKDKQNARNSSCKNIYLASINPTSGEYKLWTPTGQEFYVFCDFYNGHGYTFVSREGLNILKSLSDIYTDRSHVIVRHLQKDGIQKDVEIAPHSAFRYRYPLSFQLSKADGFTIPVNAALKPYIYLGFLPESYARRKSTQGYQAAGEDITFTNCDANPSSYLAFFANPYNRLPNNLYKICCMSTVVDAWIKKATDTPSFRYLPQTYFLEFEMGMGGCGGYVSRESFPMVSGAAIGFRFDA